MPTPLRDFGYQVKYASMVWNRSRVSTWSAATPSPATPIISMKSMNPWVALPGVCRLSSVTSRQAPVDVAGGDPLDRLAVELRVRPVRAELARARPARATGDRSR